MNRAGIKYGIFYAFIAISVYMAARYGSTNTAKAFFLANFGSMALLFPFMFFAVKQKRDLEMGGYITLKGVMKEALLTASVGGVLLALFTFLFCQFIDHAFWENLVLSEIERAKKIALEQNKTSEELTMAIEFLRSKYSAFHQATSALFRTIVAGLVLAIISSTFLVKSPEQTANNN